MHVLGIETSCDDTSAAIIASVRGKMRLLSHARFSQIAIHKKYGGVVPEVAAREHAATIIPTIQQALNEAKTPLEKIDLIAVTQGPGLAPALSVGVDSARILSAWKKIPLVGINHIAGHIASVWPIAGLAHPQHTTPDLPAIALVVSGGHTEILRITKFGSYTLLGRTRDDAAGECFDKIAALLHLPYPGGPQVSACAVKGDARAFPFPRPMLHDASLDFSFAGLKTAVRYTIEKMSPQETQQQKNNICASAQQAIVDVLVAKTMRATITSKAKSILVVGGVSANQLLRQAIMASARTNNVPVFCAPQELTSDNGVMIAMAAILQKSTGSRTIWRTLEADPSWELGRKK